METLKEALKRRKIECRVETPDFFYCGFASDLLEEISEKELSLEVKRKRLEYLYGDKRWDIEVNERQR
ncbi:hypothetical protein [Enterococcus sp. 1001283B150225_161107_E12]|uniref:hypothetical protein n=1 Tax=Enterococcus sp. 1001283B150225_161107_E12 TaxID=2787145 RepID=UPI00189D32CC|nr:hypothetical protein [Enterococcus sp. 1001283B150225_161107_E12]